MLILTFFVSRLFLFVVWLYKDSSEDIVSLFFLCDSDGKLSKTSLMSNVMPQYAQSASSALESSCLYWFVSQCGHFFPVNVAIDASPFEVNIA